MANLVPHTWFEILRVLGPHDPSGSTGSYTYLNESETLSRHRQQVYRMRRAGLVTVRRGAKPKPRKMTRVSITEKGMEVRDAQKAWYAQGD